MEQHSTQGRTSLDDIYSTIMEMRDETIYNQFEPDEDKIKRFIDGVSKSGFLYFHDGCLMMGHIYQPWFNNDKCASDILLYTKKEHRGKGAAKRAIKTFISWAKNNGAKSISLSQSTGTNQSEFSELAASLNLIKTGAVYHVR